MEEDAELAVGCEVRHRLPFPDAGVALDVVADLGGQHEEAAIDPAAFPFGLFEEARNLSTLVFYGAISAGRLRCRDGKREGHP